MLLQPVFFTLGVISAVCAAPFDPSSNLATPTLAVRAKEKLVKVVDVAFDEWGSTAPAPIETQRGIAMVVFGDESKTTAINWINGYTRGEIHWRWRRRSELQPHTNHLFGWSDKIDIPSTSASGKKLPLVDYEYEVTQILGLQQEEEDRANLTEASLKASGLNGKGG
ncbi:hypothetical protein DFJ43DRAFT_376330 [Lentinula guzmanii]|uniref:Uncharacterized protein n=1 Tax=Lentinula guzmanii TaxID=2804957 RepID=A0AA38MZH6_9AGAR|nr:hypothetical protein DFJ43DRAFT_376330 [Lentinula guzmanii]